MKAYIFGDTGGHASQLFHALENIGVNVETGEIPDDMHIIHLGDLIHKGRGSVDIMAFLEKVMKRNPEKWTQIIGNHEAMHLGLSVDFWNCDCINVGIEDSLRDMLERGQLSLYAGFSGLPVHKKYHPTTGVAKDTIKFEESEFFVSHAGLSHQLWNDLGCPDSVEELMEKMRISKVNLLRAGQMLGSTNLRAGLLWASTYELFHGWFEDPPPFDMVRGHNVIYMWEERRWWMGTAKSICKSSKVLLSARTVVTTFDNNKRILSVDPGFEMNTPRIKEQPYILIENYRSLNR